MKTTRKISLGVACNALLACAILLLAGCETQSSSATVSVTPSSTTITEGQSITFTAQGGYDYTWSLASGKEGWGTLSTRNGDTTVYTSRYSPSSNTTDNTQILTVTAWIEGAGGSSSTNSSSGSYSQSGEAYITHL